MSGLFAWIILSVLMSKSHKMVDQKSHHVADWHQWMLWPNPLCRFKYSVGASMRQPDTRWPMVSVCLSHTLHFGSAPYTNIFAWNFLVGRFWFCAAMMKPSVSDFRPDEASHRWVREDFPSGSLALIGYLPWRGLSFHSTSISLILFSFCLCPDLFYFFRRWRIFRNAVSA